jgi:hypothetical protein
MRSRLLLLALGVDDADSLRVDRCVVGELAWLLLERELSRDSLGGCSRLSDAGEAGVKARDTEPLLEGVGGAERTCPTAE